MFEVKKVKFDNLDALQLKNRKTGEFLSMIPEFGANIYDLNLKSGENVIPVLKGFKTCEELKKHHGFYNSHLFPFAGRLPDGIFNYAGNAYQFDINDSEFKAALHGFLYNKPLVLKEQIETDEKAEITVTFSSKKNSHPSYPFNITVNITYILTNEGFINKTRFINNGNHQAPIAYGIHPYFTLGNKVDDLKIKIPTKTETILSNRLVPTGETKVNKRFFNLTKIDDYSFDNGFQFSRKNGRVTTVIKNTKTDSELNIWQETGKNKFNFLQVYTPPTRDCIAIEPLCGNINSLNTGDDLMKLAPGESAEMSWGIKAK